ncbi:MAG: thiolase family protein, partial [Deinococcales bacterium]
AVIVSATRSPIGRFLGGLKDLGAPELGARVIASAIQQAGLEPAAVQEAYMGHVVQAGVGQNPTRQAALKAGMLPQSGATTINVVCGSGLKALMLAASGIRALDFDVAVAGGMESMSNAPYLMFGAREGFRAGHRELKDANMHDGLWCAFEHWRMGDAAELTAKEHGITRAEQDEFALLSHQRAIAASAIFQKEITPITLEGKKGTTTIRHDESPRPDSSLDTLAKLRPAFQKDGSVTAGNAPGINDGAAALVVMSEAAAKAHGLTPIAEVVGYATSGLEPKWFTLSPVPAIQKLLKQQNMSTSDIDLFELNEAFAVQALVVMRKLKLESSRVNIHGGAVALGHPIGCSGARIVVTLLGALAEQQKELGIASLCMGGANGLALMLRRL